MNYSTQPLLLSPVALVVTGSVISTVSYVSVAASTPDVTLAKEYHSGVNLSQYWVSEKYDGIRAIWTGKALVTKSGKPIHAPQWFIAKLPNTMIEGELWAGRGQFNVVQQTVLDTKADSAQWRKIRWMVFDMPNEKGFYPGRYKALSEWVESLASQHIQVVSQKVITNESTLTRYLHTLSDEGAEGVMLHAIDQPYRSGRHVALLKLKTYQDAEAVVIGYRPGKGRWQGMMGSLQVRIQDGTEFYIGTGFSDEERAAPPALGSSITYRYNGVNHNGKPKFARFLRVRTPGY
ncbi:DNA ligase [Vibrio tritonius]|uniref:DNA ligase n=1 Tax=Vibrio tritonius TaxID=1435069 RepID=A0ABS7YX54_9VIBR|nr:DNA ligase [Vibrio tritonius]MCA2019024.1 DNA ligase [Vibrio tritonius]